VAAAADGRVTRFSAPDDRLLGIFRVVVDEPRGALWASMGALEQMDGFAATHKGAGGIAELDLATGAVRRVIMAPADGAPHLLGDFVQLADGTILATDVATAITAVDVLTADPAMPDATLGTLVTATWSSSPMAAGTGSSRGKSTRARGRCRY